jgi:hypothetical protein
MVHMDEVVALQGSPEHSNPTSEASKVKEEEDAAHIRHLTDEVERLRTRVVVSAHFVCVCVCVYMCVYTLGT